MRRCGSSWQDRLASLRMGRRFPYFRGQGVQPGVDLTDNAALVNVMNAESAGSRWIPA